MPTILAMVASPLSPMQFMAPRICDGTFSGLFLCLVEVLGFGAMLCSESAVFALVLQNVFAESARVCAWSSLPPRKQDGKTNHFSHTRTKSVDFNTNTQENMNSQIHLSKLMLI